METMDEEFLAAALEGGEPMTEEKITIRTECTCVQNVSGETIRVPTQARTLVFLARLLG